MTSALTQPTGDSPVHDRAGVRVRLAVEGGEHDGNRHARDEQDHAPGHARPEAVLQANIARVSVM